MTFRFRVFQLCREWKKYKNTSSRCKNGPPMTRSMACSKCLLLTDESKCLAAISAASLQTLAMSAPDSFREK